MKSNMGVLVLLASAFVTVSATAQAPAGATGQCKDNSYTTAAKKWQACSGHQGVQTWYADAKPAAAPAPAPAATAPTATKTAAAAKAAPNVAAAPGGGPGLVWVNTATNVYHCPGGSFYGKTKEGKYMTEADAKKAGARPDRNKVCTK